MASGRQYHLYLSHAKPPKAMSPTNAMISQPRAPDDHHNDPDNDEDAAERYSASSRAVSRAAIRFPSVVHSGDVLPRQYLALARRRVATDETATRRRRSPSPATSPSKYLPRRVALQPRFSPSSSKKLANFLGTPEFGSHEVGEAADQPPLDIVSEVRQAPSRSWSVKARKHRCTTSTFCSEIRAHPNRTLDHLIGRCDGQQPS